MTENPQVTSNKKQTIRKSFVSCILYLVSLHERGFSLIELVVVLGMLSILFISLLVTFNPLTQFNKANDGQREHDLGQIKQALDTYYNDTGCYPTALNFGSPWKSGSTVYMQMIPQDPNCAQDSKKCYVYQVDTTSSCPQWNVLYAALRAPVVSQNSCPLVARNCLPKDFVAGGYNYCAVSGNIDCSVVIASIIVPGGLGNGGGGSGGTPTPTQTPHIVVCQNGYYACTGDNRCNSIGVDRNGNPTLCYGYGGTTQCYCDQHCNQSCRYN